MSCCKRKEEIELYIDNNNCAKDDNIHVKRGSILDSQFCLCRNNEGCFIPADCNILQSTNIDTISTCLEPCQCVEEMEWNCCTPPRPSYKWLNNFCELRRQWSNHARQQNCRCCNCTQRVNVTGDVTNPVSVNNDTTGSTSHTCIHTCSKGWKKKNTYCSLISYIGSIGYTTLIPSPMALVSFTLFVFITVGLSSGLIIYQHYSSSVICLKHSN